VEFILFIIAVLFGILGAVRYSRTGSIREGIRFFRSLQLSGRWGGCRISLPSSCLLFSRSSMP
jgi:hypothetical protein